MPLTSRANVQVGVVVNDVADVNIDAKLVRERSSSGIQTSRGDGVEFVELQNGCACCDASGELLVCIEQLLEMAHIGIVSPFANTSAPLWSASRWFRSLPSFVSVIEIFPPWQSIVIKTGNDGSSSLSLCGAQVDTSMTASSSRCLAWPSRATSAGRSLRP